MSEALQLRVHGGTGQPGLIYLPGLHGDWTLITRLRQALGERVRFAEFTYPRTTTWTLNDHAVAVKASLLEQGIRQGWVLAESFGSQIAWPFLEAAAPEFQVEGLILAGGFVRHPWPWAVSLARFVCQRAPLKLIRGMLATYARLVRLGDRRDPVLQQGVQEFLARRTEVDRLAVTHRLRLIRDSDLRASARSTRASVYHLCGAFDLTVPWPLVKRSLQRDCPGWRGSRVVRTAEHSVLVTAPSPSADAVLAWMRVAPSNEKTRQAGGSSEHTLRASHLARLD